jgi:hypothetical protein
MGLIPMPRKPPPSWQDLSANFAQALDRLFAAVK